MPVAKNDPPNATIKPEDQKPDETDKPKVTEVPRENVSPTTMSKPDAPKAKEEDQDNRPQSYVHLADGSVARCYDEDLPIPGGTGSPHGFWQRGDAVYVIVGIYPVESKVEA
jgi:hypothetical protein